MVVVEGICSEGNKVAAGARSAPKASLLCFLFFVSMREGQNEGEGGGSRWQGVLGVVGHWKTGGKEV